MDAISTVNMPQATHEAAKNAAVWFAPSNASTLVLRGRGVFPFLQRLSTNDLLSLGDGELRPTLFLNANGRCLERVLVQRMAEKAILYLGTGRETRLGPYLRRNIFFRDEVVVDDSAEWTHFEIHGPQSQEVIAKIQLHQFVGYAYRMQEYSEQRWFITVQTSFAATLWSQCQSFGGQLPLADSSLREILRIEAGCPAPENEINPNFTPLELGLLADISFQKGCYIGQEIIARMESRHKIPRLLVQLECESPLILGATLLKGGKPVGVITSQAHRADGEGIGLSVVRRFAAKVGVTLQLADQSASARITGIAGQQPSWALP